MSNCDQAFYEGLTVAVSLARAGCSGDDMALLLPEDPAYKDPAGYQDQLRDLRRILRTDLMTEVTT